MIEETDWTHIQNILLGVGALIALGLVLSSVNRVMDGVDGKYTKYIAFAVYAAVLVGLFVLASNILSASEY